MHAFPLPDDRRGSPVLNISTVLEKPPSQAGNQMDREDGAFADGTGEMWTDFLTSRERER
jgi:hypothetical protein